MPFVSDKQRKFLYANYPEVAKKFAADEKKLGTQKTVRKNRERR